MIKEKESFATNIGFLQDAVDDLELVDKLMDSIKENAFMGFDQQRVPQNVRTELGNAKKSIEMLDRILNTWVRSG